MELLLHEQAKHAGIHLFRCAWNDTWYGERQEFIFALDSQHANDIVDDRFNLNNTVKELNIKEIEIREVTRVPRQAEVLVKESSNKPGEGIVKSQYYVQITRFHCSHCGNQVMPGGDFCDKCGGYFTKGSVS